MTDLRLHWLEAAGSLAEWRGAIEADITLGWQAAARAVALPPIDLVVQRVPRGGIPELGMVGVAYRRNCFSLTLDPDNVHFANALADGAVRRLVVHEIAHCLRFVTTGHPETLGDALIAEGLCGWFVHECLGTTPEPWERALTTAELATWMPRARAEARSRHDHAVWFWAAGETPRWAGYAVGYALVGQILAAHPGTHASDMLALPTEQMLMKAGWT